MRIKLEMFRRRGVVRELCREGRCGIERCAGFGPDPERTPPGSETAQVPLPLVQFHICRQDQNLPAEAERTAGLGQQPAQLHGGLLPELCRFDAAAVGEQIQRGAISPATEIQGTYPWDAFGGDGGELQPTARW
jgi:hypothetical protein